MKNHWLDRIKERDLVAAHWTPPTDDESGWYPIHPKTVCAEVSEELAKELTIPGLTITVSDTGWKEVELQASCCGYFATEGPATPDFVISNVPPDLTEEESVLMQKLWALKLQILSQNPQGLMIPADEFAFDLNSEYDDDQYDYAFDL